MNLILFCVFLTFSIGLFLLLAGLLRLPTLKTSRVMMDTGKEGKQLSKTLDAFYNRICNISDFTYGSNIIMYNYSRNSNFNNKFYYLWIINLFSTDIYKCNTWKSCT